jgi:MFS family permease
VIQWQKFLPALPGLLAGLASYLVLFGVLFVIPFATKASWVLTALPAMIAITAPFAGSLVVRVGGRALTIAGMLASAAGLIFLSLASGGWPTAAALGVIGVGIGAFTPANNAGIMALAPPGQPGMTSGVLNMTRGLGTSAGVALTGAVYTMTSGNVLLSLLTLAAVALLAALLSGCTTGIRLSQS